MTNSTHAYKGLITDLDGTAVLLTSDGSDVDELTRRSIKTAQSKDFKIACATGRWWGTAKPVVVTLGLTSLCIIEGGTRLIDPVSEQVHWEKAMDRGTSSEVLEILKKHTREGLLMHSVKPEPVPFVSVKNIPKKLHFIYLLDVPADKSQQILNEINLSGVAVAHITASWYGKGNMDIHITDPEATKEHAVKIWQELEGIDITETIGMGDSGNDLPLFQAVGLKVAVNNATDEVKAMADYIAPANTEHALKHVIDTFLLG